MWLGLTLSTLVLSGCDDGVRAESRSSAARDSALSRDLEIAQGRAPTPSADASDSGEVSVSPGMLDSADAEDTTDLSESSARSASAASAASPSAEGYIGPSCASPDLDDQRRCLLGYLARSDAELDRKYQALIGQLKREARTSANAPEPPAVSRLRTAQRSWLVYRDDECRKRTRADEGPLWAPVRASCLAEYSELRTRELDDALAARKALAARTEPAKSASASSSGKSGASSRKSSASSRRTARQRSGRGR